MIDTHAHLDFKEFDEDREEVIRRAFDNGVKAIINVGCDLERSVASVVLAEQHENIFAAVGMHPHEFTQGDLGDHGNKGDWIGELEKLAKSEKVVAIGETGLDYFHVSPASPELQRGEQDVKQTAEGFEKVRKLQREAFIKQIDLATKLGLPVIVHCRDAKSFGFGQDQDISAWDDLFSIVSQGEFHGANFVLHCYSGGVEDTEKFMKLKNVSFSFSGNITYPKPADGVRKLADAVRKIPMKRIMLDSDSPYLAPQAVRGKRNEPKFVGYIAEKIAEIKGISAQEVEHMTDENAKQFFRI